eukprot:458802-Rhodomonas_salina.1
MEPSDHNRAEAVTAWPVGDPEWEGSDALDGISSGVTAWGNVDEIQGEGEHAMGEAGLPAPVEQRIL